MESRRMVTQVLFTLILQGPQRRLVDIIMYTAKRQGELSFRADTGAIGNKAAPQNLYFVPVQSCQLIDE